MYPEDAIIATSQILALAQQPELTLSLEHERYRRAATTPPMAPQIPFLDRGYPSREHSDSERRVRSRPNYSRSFSGIHGYRADHARPNVLGLEHYPVQRSYSLAQDLVNSVPRATDGVTRDFPSVPMVKQFEAVDLNRKNSFNAHQHLMPQCGSSNFGDVIITPSMNSGYTATQQTHPPPVDPLPSASTSLGVNPFISIDEQAWDKPLQPLNNAASPTYDGIMAEMDFSSFDSSGLSGSRYKTPEMDLSRVQCNELDTSFPGHSLENTLATFNSSTVRPTDTQINPYPLPDAPAVGNFSSSPPSLITDNCVPYSAPQHIRQSSLNASRPPASQRSSSATTAPKHRSPKHHPSTTTTMSSSSSSSSSSPSSSSSSTTTSPESTSGNSYPSHHSLTPCRRSRTSKRTSTPKHAAGTRSMPPNNRSSPNTGDPPPRTSKREKPFNFVNLTPDDGRAILAGVAPSGSAKTKAKREKERELRELRELGRKQYADGMFL